MTIAALGLGAAVALAPAPASAQFFGIGLPGFGFGFGVPPFGFAPSFFAPPVLAPAPAFGFAGFPIHRGFIRRSFGAYGCAPIHHAFYGGGFYHPRFAMWHPRRVAFWGHPVRHYGFVGHVRHFGFVGRGVRHFGFAGRGVRHFGFVGHRSGRFAMRDGFVSRHAMGRASVTGGRHAMMRRSSMMRG